MKTAHRRHSSGVGGNRQRDSSSNNITGRAGTYERLSILDKLKQILLEANRADRRATRHGTHAANIAGNSVVNANNVLRRQLCGHKESNSGRALYSKTPRGRAPDQRANGLRGRNSRHDRMRHRVAKRMSMLRAQNRERRSISGRTRRRSGNNFEAVLRRSHTSGNFIIQRRALRVRYVLRRTTGEVGYTKGSKDTYYRRRRSRRNSSNTLRGINDLLTLRNGARRQGRDRGGK